MVIKYPKPLSDTKPKDQQRQKAVIKTLEEPMAELHCQFNPAQIKFSKTTQWNSKTDKTGGGGNKARGSEPKRNVPTSEFQGGNAQTLSMDLFFDTAETGDDVREYTDFLTSLTLINPKMPKTKARPMLVMFIWGSFSDDVGSISGTRSLMTFRAYVKDVNINFTMFNTDGTPLRAETQVTFTAFEDNNAQPFQNPTSRSETRTMYVTRAGETLDYVAYREYGDSSQWRHIAQVNNLNNPMRLKPGTVLKITPLPE